MPLYKHRWLLPFLLLFCATTPALAQPVFENARLVLGGGYDTLIDPQGNTVRVSFFYDSLDVDRDGTTDFFSRGGSDLLILSEAPDGTLNWARSAGSDVKSLIGSFGIQPTEETRKIAQDAQGGLYMAGQFYGSIDFNQDQVLDITAPHPDTSAMFVAKYAQDGTFQWARAFGGNHHRLGELAYNPGTGTLFLAGVRFNYDEAGERLQSDFLLVELNTEGTSLRESTIPLSDLDPPSPDYHLTAFPTQLRFDTSNNIYILGRYWGPFNHQSAFFVARYNAQLEIQWVRQSSSLASETRGFIVDDQKHIWVSGSYSSSPISGIDFSLSDSDTTYVAPIPEHSSDLLPGIFIARYTPDGAIGCVRFVPNMDSPEGRAYSTLFYMHQPFSSSVITGLITRGEFDFDEDGVPDLNSSQNYLSLIMGLSPDCSLDWTWHSVRNLTGHVLKGPGSTYRFEGVFGGSQLLLDGLEDESPILIENPTTSTRFATEVTFTDPALPVELVDFSLVQNKGAVTLSWQTASELNNAGFEIQQKMQDDWHPIIFIDGAGTTNEPQHYTHTLANLPPGTYQFRLKQIDFDGTFAFSEVQTLHIGQDQAYILSEAYPNPFNPQTTFTLSIAREQDVRITLYDLTGRELALLHEGPLTANATHTFVVDGSRLSSGVYMYRVDGEFFAESKKVLLVK